MDIRYNDKKNSQEVESPQGEKGGQTDSGEVSQDPGKADAEETQEEPKTG